MVSVNTKTELESVLKQRITNFVIEDRKLCASSIIANEIRTSNLADLTPTSLVNNKLCTEVGVTTEVAITLIICLTAITIVAIIKNYDVELEIDPQTGNTKAKFHK